MTWRYWTTERIESELKHCISIIGEDHFPTHSELINQCNCKALAVAVSKNGGTKYWADKLNMPIKNCESTLGNTFEIQAINDIKLNTNLESVTTVPRYPYDLYTADCIKIDIKASLPLKRSKIKDWSFNLEKKMPTCDIFIFYCLDKDHSIIKTCIVPSSVLSGITQVGMGSLSKYDSYTDRWDLILDYYKFYLEQKNKIAFIPKRRSSKIKTE